MDSNFASAVQKLQFQKASYSRGIQVGMATKYTGTSPVPSSTSEYKEEISHESDEDTMETDSKALWLWFWWRDAKWWFDHVLAKSLTISVLFKTIMKTVIGKESYINIDQMWDCDYVG